MLEFDFRVCKSFLNYPSHPITIPIRFNDEVKKDDLDSSNIDLVAPEGQIYSGKIYEGYNNQGLYYQIRLEASPFKDKFSELSLGQGLHVTISESVSRKLVRLILS